MKATLELLGCKVRDKVTGLTGTITSVCFDLYGCVQAVVHPGLDKDGKPGESNWYDVSRLVVVDHQPVMPNLHLSPAPVVKGPASKPVPNRA